MRKQIFVLILGVILFSSSIFGKDKTLAASDVKIKKEILAKLNNRFDDVATEVGAKRWEEAARLAAQYEDSEIMNRMLYLVRDADGGPSEALPSFLFKVFEKNPVFFLKRALVSNGGHMDYVVGYFLNEIEGWDVNHVIGPLKDIEAKHPEFELAQKFRRAAGDASKNKK